MKAKIHFEHLYDNCFELETKTDIYEFFKNMKEKVCEDLQAKNCAMSSLYKDRPIWEKVVVKVVSSQREEKEDGYRYQATFQVEGMHSKTCYDQIVVELEDVDFLKKVPSIDEYLSMMFKLRYSGFLMTMDDVKRYAEVSNKSFKNERIMSLCRIDEVVAKEFETHADKVKRLAFGLARFVGKKPFEIVYILGGSEQRVFYVYDKKEHFSFLSYLVDRTRTHDVQIRFIDNEISEWFQITKGYYETKIRKILA